MDKDIEETLAGIRNGKLKSHKRFDKVVRERIITDDRKVNGVFLTERSIGIKETTYSSGRVEKKFILVQ